MPAPNLSQPYPPSYRPPKLKGVPKVVQAMAQPPIGWGVGFGQSEEESGDEPLPGSREGQEQQQPDPQVVVPGGDWGSAFPIPITGGPQMPQVDPRARHFDLMPQFGVPFVNVGVPSGFGIGQSEGDFMPHDPRPLIGWQPSPLAQAGQVFSNFGSTIHNLPGPLGQLTGAAGDLANLAMPQSGQAGIGGVPSALKDSAMTPLNMLGRMGSDVQPNNVANAITANLPGANKPVPQTNVPVLTGAADLANQLTAPGLGLSPEVGELATQAARLPGRAGDIAANVALGVKGIPRIAGGSVPKGKIRVPSVDEINQYVAQHPGNVSDLLTQFRDALPDMQPEQVQEALGIFRQHDPTIFKKQGVKGLVTEAAAASKAGDAQTVSQNVTEAADAVRAKRDQEAAQAAQAAGKPPKPPKKPPIKPPDVGPLPPADEPVIAALPDAPSDIQDAVVSVVADKMRKPYMTGAQVAAHAVGGVTGAVGGWNAPGYLGKTQDEKDNIKYKAFTALAGGLIGLGLGDVVAGGPARGVADRTGSWLMRQWLTPATIGLKGVTDIPSTLFAPAVHGFERTANFGPKVGAQQALEYLRGYRMGVKPAFDRLATELSRQVGDFNPAMQEETQRAVATPGNVAGSLISRIIGGMTGFYEELHAAAGRAADAPLLAQEEARLNRTVNAGQYMPWFQKQVQSDKNFADTIALAHPDEWAAIESGLWSDQDVQDVAKGYYVNRKVLDYQQTKLGGDPAARARQWTLTSDIAPLIQWPRTITDGAGNVIARTPAQFNTKGTTGLVGRVSYLPGSLVSKANIPLGEGRSIPIGRLLGGFYKIASNAIDQSINWTPLLGDLNQMSFGPFSLYKDIPTGRRIGKQVIGGALTLGLVHAIGDNATGSGPTYDKNLYSSWRDTHTPESVNIDGHWIPSKYLGPYAYAAAHAAGALNDYHDYEMWWKQQHGESPNPQAIAHMALGELFQGIGDQGYFQSINDLFNMFLGTGTTQTSAIGFQIGGLVPEPAALAATSERPTKPSTSGSYTADALSRIPGAEQNVPPQRDAMGQPVPNPQQGAKALLGAYAGQQPMQDTTADQWLAPIGKEQAPGLGTLNARVFHGTYDNQGNLVPGSGLPMPPGIRGAVQQRTGQILQQNTDALFNSDAYQKLSDANKAKAARAYQTAAHDQAFFDVVGQFGRDKYLASLNPQQQSQFRDLELTQQLAQAGAKNRYALANGQPYDPSKWAAMDKAIAQWSGKPNPPAAVVQFKRLQAYGRAANLTNAVASEDWSDYARRKYLSGLSDADWQAFQGGQVALYGKPGQYSPAQQLQFLGATEIYNALPAGDQRKNKMAAQVAALKKQSNIALLKKAQSPTAAVQAAEAA